MGKGSGGSSSTPVEAPNSLISLATVRIIDLISEGEADSIVGGLQGIYLDNTAIQNSDGSTNFRNLIIDSRAGTPDQTSIHGFSAAEAVFSVGTEVRFDTPVVRAIANPDADAVRVTVRVDALEYTDPKTGNIGPTTVGFGIDSQLNGGVWNNVSPANAVISGKTNSSYQRSFRIERPGPGAWSIRVRRITPDNSSSNLVNKTYWDSITEIEDQALAYPHSVLLAYQADAHSFGGSVPTRLVRLRGLKTRIPTNYDPITRVYTGIWDGTFQTAWHNNPAWALYECIANDRWGIGEYVPDAFRDKWTLYSIGQYCDALVPNGLGGTEPRYTFNFAIAAAVDAMRMLMSIASVFRGMIFWGAAGVAATADQDLDPVKLIAPANVIGGVINWGGGSLRARHSAVTVTWYDPTNLCQPTIEAVEGTPADIARFGYRTLDIVAVGCTSRGQARRMGKWAIETEASEAETCTWQASYDHADVYPGEIVEIADPAYSGVQFGGRVAGLVLSDSDVTGLTLDRPIFLDPLKTYTLNVTLADGTVAVRPVTTPPSTTATLSFAAPLDPAPIVNAIWVLTASDVAPRRVKIIKRVESALNVFDLSGILHDPGKFARIEQNLVLDAPSWTTFPTGPLLPPTAIFAKEYLTLISAAVHSNIALSWVLSTDPRVKEYEIQVLPPGMNWQPANPNFSNSTSVDLLDLATGQWGFRVRGLDAFARSSPWDSIQSFDAVGMSVPPDDVTNIRASAYVDSNTSIAWDEIADVRAIRYSVRSGDTWDSGLDLGTIAHPPFAAHGNGTYQVKAYTGADSARVYSINAATITVAGVSLSRNIVATRDEGANGWTGVFTGTVGKSGSLIHTGGAGDILSLADFLATADLLNRGGQGNGTYEIAPSRYINAGRTAPCRVTCTWKGTSQIVSDNFLANPDILNDPDFLAASASNLVDVHAEISFALDATTALDIFAPDPVTDPSGDIFQPSDIFSLKYGEWIKYEPGIYLGQFFRARLVLNTLDPQVVAVALNFTFSVDVPDRLDTWALVAGVGTSLNQITVPSGGLAIVFASNGKSLAEAFNGGPGTDTVPLIQITNTSSSAFDFEVQSLTLAGCTIVPRLAGTPTDAPQTNISIQGW